MLNFILTIILGTIFFKALAKYIEKHDDDIPNVSDCSTISHAMNDNMDNE